MCSSTSLTRASSAWFSGMAITGTGVLVHRAVSVHSAVRWAMSVCVATYGSPSRVYP